MNLLDHDLSIPGEDFLIHLDDTYESVGEHDGLVMAVALAGWRVLPASKSVIYKLIEGPFGRGKTANRGPT